MRVASAATSGGPNDPGSPWAIGGEDGGHRDVHPDLGTIDAGTVGMTTCVIVGSSTTRVIGGRMVTPRGYHP